MGEKKLSEADEQAANESGVNYDLKHYVARLDALGCHLNSCVTILLDVIAKSLDAKERYEQKCALLDILEMVHNEHYRH